MKRTDAKRESVRKSLKAKPKNAKRLKQIQSVFDQLGIGTEEARRSVRPQLTPASDHVVQYRVILSGSTLG